MRTTVSPKQRETIFRLWDEGLRSPQISERIGVPMPVVRAIIARQYNPESWRKLAQEQGATAEVADAIETTFGLERDLQQALRSNIGQLERGLKITDNKKEQRVPSGYIDIKAQDRKGSTVVIELKAGEADRDAVGQILSYMGDIMNHSGKPVRGILIAASFSLRAISAARASSNLELKRYSFKFSFQSESL